MLKSGFLLLLVGCVVDPRIVGTWTHEIPGAGFSLEWLANADGTCEVVTLGTACTFTASTTTSELALDEPTDLDCGTYGEGIYHYGIQGDILTLTVINDPCPSLDYLGFPGVPRSAVVSGDWQKVTTPPWALLRVEPERGFDIKWIDDTVE